MRILTISVLAFLALATPAAGSQVFQVDKDGRLTPREIPALPPPAGPELAVPGGEQRCPLPKARAAAGPSIKKAIASARRRGTISGAEATLYRRSYAAARKAVRGRRGRNRRELSSVLNTMAGIAARGKLSGGRMPALFLQLDRNRQFWRGKPNFPARPDLAPDPCTRPPSNSPAGARIVFEGSPVVFQYYPGQGLQLQPLANFGLVNGLVTGCRRDPATCDRATMKQLLDELVAMRSSRGGFVTWEYWFYFGGGSPPWTSGLSSATALQALARASEPSILNDKSYLRVGRKALDVFRKGPPTGVRVRSGRGSHYLIYSFDRGLRVLNAFLQAINGLYDFAKVSEDRTARALWKAGDRAAQHELRLYDTGRWSRYSVGGAEASLGYHRLVTDFLDDLCKRLHGRYCRYYERFRSYLGDKPVVKYTGRAEGTVGRPLRLLYRVNKASCVTAEVTDTSGNVVFRERKKVARGEHRFLWTPEAAGPYVLTLGAVDQNKNATSPSFTITING